MLVCGISEPGIAPIDSRKSSSSATRIEVSCRQNHRAQPTGPSEGKLTSSVGAVESWDPAAPRSVPASAAACAPGSGPPPGSRGVSVLVDINQIPTVKLCVQPWSSDIRLSQTPVTRRMPSATIMPPPARMTHR